MLNSNITALAHDAAKRYQLPAPLVLAIVQAESGGDPWAIRYEPGFFQRYIAGKPVLARAPCSEQTEATMQATSWGLMQVMGATARERGFRGVFLSEMCDPRIGLDWGCCHLDHLTKKHLKVGGWAAVVAAYNAGSPKKENGQFVNQAYVDKIVRFGGFS